ARFARIPGEREGTLALLGWRLRGILRHSALVLLLSLLRSRLLGSGIRLGFRSLSGLLDGSLLVTLLSAGRRQCERSEGERGQRDAILHCKSSDLAIVLGRIGTRTYGGAP